MIQYIEARSILSKLRQTDSFFGIGYNMNLYRGCQHACIYCDTRSDCYQIGDISNIRVKKNAIELLKKELSRKKGAKATIGTGSMNDPYMPVEAELQLCRQALQVLADKKYPVHIITKSSLVTRDTDILQELAKTYAAVSLTITTADDTLARKLEPNASKTSERFKAIEVLAKNGIYAGITLMPILPFINDTIENLDAICRMAKDAGASYIIPMFGVTLRKGSREYFYKLLDTKFKGLKEKYEASFGQQYECYSRNYQHLGARFNELSKQLGINHQMKFYTPPNNEQLSIF